MKVPFSYAYTFTIFYYFQYIDYYPLNKYSTCDDSQLEETDHGRKKHARKKSERFLK